MSRFQFKILELQTGSTLSLNVPHIKVIYFNLVKYIQQYTAICTKHHIAGFRGQLKCFQLDKKELKKSDILSFG